eukprot:g128.t1
MGRSRRDGLYTSETEWKILGGGKLKKKEGKGLQLSYKSCALTFKPVSNPCCTPDGIVFDLLSIVPYIRKFKRHPFTRKPLSMDDLVHLKFHRNADGEIHCPASFKTFTDHSYIAAIKTTGNVYSYSAIKNLNIKLKSWKDLLTGESFKRSDIIELQNPSCPRIIYPKEEDSTEEVDDSVTNTKSENIRLSSAAKRVFDHLDQVESKEEHKRLFERTPEENSTEIEKVIQNPKKWKQVKKLGKKGYVRLCTTLGDVLIELHCNLVPRTCDNFIGLCKKKYFNGVPFHRVIRNFMAQSGDPSGTGRGGSSVWSGEKFADEFHPKLRHSGRGIVSMANSGPNSNGSQFFITFESCTHLDDKHSVFGQVVDGIEVLQSLESLPVEGEVKGCLAQNMNRPKALRKWKPGQNIKTAKTVVDGEELVIPLIVSTEVLEDPYVEVDLAEEKIKKRKRMKREEMDEIYIGRAQEKKTKSSSKSTSFGMVGKYLKKEKKKKKEKHVQEKANLNLVPRQSKKVPSKEKQKFDFSSW